MAYSLGKLCNAFHVVKPLRKFVRHRLPFCHAHQPTSSVFGHCSLTPHFENHLVRANPQAKQVIVVSVQPNVVELESAVRAKRSRFHFKSCISDPKVRGRNSPSIANCYVILAQEAPYEFLANLAAVSIAKHPVSYQRRVAPDVFRRVFPDDGHQQVHWFMPAVPKCSSPSRFSKTRGSTNGSSWRALGEPSGSLRDDFGEQPQTYPR